MLVCMLELFQLVVRLIATLQLWLFGSAAVDVVLAGSMTYVVCFCLHLYYFSPSNASIVKSIAVAPKEGLIHRKIDNGGKDHAHFDTHTRDKCNHWYVAFISERKSQVMTLPLAAVAVVSIVLFFDKSVEPPVRMHDLVCIRQTLTCCCSRPQTFTSWGEFAFICKDKERNNVEPRIEGTFWGSCEYSAWIDPRMTQIDALIRYSNCFMILLNQRHHKIHTRGQSSRSDSSGFNIEFGPGPGLRNSNQPRNLGGVSGPQMRYPVPPKVRVLISEDRYEDR